ncbi:BREX-1 system adenine-specific DNA-methyltransferase PglX [Simiaoa sunii]|jgi:type II restriction/modification system DNA methylase subunit YeeA|uniref:site-specific DNA-methyltransferase (adenine-specific) n=1 Tax=Simiaoa sunii TaxID=2763672 RepID=A0A7G9FXV3_9FIRM|nr:BREX-1 system adenine-specific DNA-methyltransferase PglX [Simiaoa sunii]QNM03385.1 BREX-1 system adenine-specific DNA-methyltransferase PglX [Simiaoa sunii]
MNKTAIRNFAIWARNRLIADIKYRAGLMGITENGIADALPQSNSTTEFYDIGTAEPYAINGEEIKQRRALVDVIRAKEEDSDYAVAYKYIIEEVAYTWFNRLIAVRFMEVNDYLPSHVRVLSAESGKTEPDIVTNPFDAELNLLSTEEEKIITLKRENKLDEAFKMLFIKQCNALNEILPALFEKTSDYTELLLNLSVIDQDGVVYHLVHDIPEEDFNVSAGGQVEIIGWMYQYYNTEPKNDAFAKKGKITKEEVPAVTQLFTPDWIVRYMVENSLGRLWVEGHPDADLQGKWKYYLEEAEQEPEVQAELAKIREEYAKLKPEDIKLIDPCMGSGHILVYAFDKFMQIYENAGWSAREAAQSIVEHNIYGLDIDDRAAQLSYFAVMMKARQYDRRIFTRGVRPNVYAIQESNGINREQLKYFGAELDEMEKNTAILQIEGFLDTLIDAKEYGSILNVDEYDWDLLRRWVNSVDMGSQISFDTYGLDATVEKLNELIEIGAIMAQKYEVVATNPPYAGTSNLSAKVNNFVKKHYPDSKADLFAVFIERCGEMLTKNGFQAMITMHAWMFLSGYEKLRLKLANFDKVTLVHLGARAFDEISGEVVQTVSFVVRKNSLSGYKAIYLRLVDGCNQSQKEKLFFDDGIKYIATENNFTYIPGHRIAYWIDGKKLFSHKLIGDFCESGGRNKTHNNELYVRNWWEIGKSKYEWRHYDNGGNSRKWYGNCLDIVNWSAEAKAFYASHGGLLKDEICEKRGVSWNGISSGNYRFKIKLENFSFSSSSPTIIGNTNIIYSIIAVLNSKVAPYILNAINPTLQLNVGEILGFPMVDLSEDLLQQVDTIAKKCVEMVRVDWDSFETSWDFKRHPLLSVIPRNSTFFDNTDDIDLAECYTCWENECNERFNQLKANEEELNRIFIDIYGLQDELTPEVEDKDVTVRKADLQRDIKSLISYAVGCMFGRYSLNEEGLVYAGGEWGDSKYTTFIPDADNIIPITDEEYLEDDIVSRFCAWLKTAFGAKSLETNLDFIAKALGNKGDTSREIIRNYFLNDFFKDHCNTYSVTGSGKRPIYWLFDSGKQNGFKALIYLHRYNADTIGNVRVDYLYRMQRVYESEIGRMQDTIDNSKNSREVSLATKRKEKLQKQLKECREYDEKIGHLALSRIELDLDDGVKVNYRKVQTASDGKFYEILADSKNIMAKEK